MAQIDANEIRLEYESFGSVDDETILLIMGLAKQLTAWHLEFCEELVGRGFRVIRFDNRDVGLSEKFDDAEVPDVVHALLTRQPPEAPYSLDDMAADAVGLLIALEIEKAHVAGASMGGMIAQTMAINHPDRVMSLTSIGSKSGNPDLPTATPEAIQALIAPAPPAHDLDAVIERGLQTWRVLGSPEYPTPEELRIEWIRRDFERSYYPIGSARQLAAALAHGDRRAGLRDLDLPAVVLHGSADPLFPVEAGEDTAANIPGAEFRIIEGAGHDFPLQLIGAWADAIEAAARR